MEKLSIIFCGTPDFAVPSLRVLAEDTALDVRLVITQSDKPVGRSHVVTPPPVKIVAEGKGIPVWQPEDINTEWSRCPAPTGAPTDYLVVVAYGQILSQEILDAPKIAPINLHASLLPRWRGASPIQHAILGGDPSTGVTIQRIVRRVDAGPILAQTVSAVAARETFASLHDRLAIVGANLLCETLKNPLQEREQDESQATHCRKLARDAGDADPATMTAEEIDRRVRAFVPWPGVLCRVKGAEIKLLETALEPEKDALALPCRNETMLFVTRLQSPGRTAVTGAEWLRGIGGKR